MVIQRIYVPAAVNSNTNQTPIHINTRLPVKKLSTSSEISDGSNASFATSPLEMLGPSAGRSPSSTTSRYKNVERLLAQHTGSSVRSLDSVASAPVTPLDGIRAASTLSVLKPSDFARRKSVFMKDAKQPNPQTLQFKQKLEWRYTTAPTPADLHEDSTPLPPDSLNSPVPLSNEQRSVSAQIPPRSSATLGSDSRPRAITLGPTGAPKSTRIEYQVLALNQQLVDTTKDTQQLSEEISNASAKVELLKQEQSVAQQRVEQLSQQASEFVPKDSFDQLNAEASRAAKEYETALQKSEQGQKEVQRLSEKLAAMNKQLEQQEEKDGEVVATKKTLQSAIERLRNQVESVEKVSSESAPTSPMSSQSATRYGLSDTLVPLGRAPRPAASNADAVSLKTEPAGSAATGNPTATNGRRRNQVFSMIITSPNLPERQEVDRHLHELYQPVLRARSPVSQESTLVSPTTPSPANELSKDMKALVDGFSADIFDKDKLVFDMAKKADPGKGTIKKKQGWGARLKLKLTGQTAQAEPEPKPTGPPILAPIDHGVPLNLSFSQK